MNDDGDVHHDLEAYRIGALDARDRSSFERHLATCASCSTGVASYAEAMAALGSIVSPPPPVAPRLPVRPPDRRRTLVVGSLAAACVAIVGAFAGPTYERDRAHERAYAEIARMLATDAVDVTLVGDAGISGRAIVGEGRAESGFIVSGLPPPAAGFVYRVWVRGAAKRVSPGVLERTAEGLEVLVTSGDVLARGTSIHVMLESASLETADRLPRRQMLLGTIG